MSQENVEVVLSLWPDRDTDATQLYRDDDMWARWLEVATPYLHEDYELVTMGLPAGDTSVRGLEGDRNSRLDWLEPWAAYRQEIEPAIDCGDRVLLLVRAFGRFADASPEVSHAAAEVVHFRDGKIDRIELYGSRARAVKAVGLGG